MVEQRNGRAPGRKERDERSRRFGDKGQRFEIWCETADRCQRVGWAPHYGKHAEGALKRAAVVAVIVWDRVTGRKFRGVRGGDPPPRKVDVKILGPDGEAVR